MSIVARNISKQFRQFVALDNVSLEITQGELLVLLGPSGSGKTTLLRILAGLEFADAGEVLLQGESLADKPIQERDVGFVFQHYALFKHMTVFENVAFGLRVRNKKRGLSESQIHEKVMSLLKLVHLETFHHRYPHQLSGGQRQRVALARSLAIEPKVLLLDEPFGALDAKVRKELRRWLRRLHEDIPITTIFVTHDQDEALEVADRVVVMSHGKIEQIGTPDEVWHKPRSAFVYDFLGNYNEFEGWKDAQGNVHLAEEDRASAPEKIRQPGNASGVLARYPILGKFIRGLKGEAHAFPAEIKKSVVGVGQGQHVKVYARPHEIYIAHTPDAFEYVQARVVHINLTGSLVKMELERPTGQIIQVEVPRAVVEQMGVKKGDALYLRPKVMKVFEE